MIKIHRDEIGKYELVKGIHKKNYGTIKIIRFSFGLYYICERRNTEEKYECYCIDENYYFNYKKNNNTEINKYEELEEVFTHSKWEEKLQGERLLEERQNY